MITALLHISLTEKPHGSNSTKTELSRVKARTKIIFSMRRGDMSTLLRCKGELPGAMDVEPEWVIGKVDPFSTTI